MWAAAGVPLIALVTLVCVVWLAVMLLAAEAIRRAAGACRGMIARRAAARRPPPSPVLPAGEEARR